MSKKILICDDEEGIRESLKLILEKDNEVIFAETGDEALEKVRTMSLNLVILDIKMPKKDGLETLKEIKKIAPKLNVIIATGYKSVDTAQEAIKLGASDYIVKPFDRDKISKLVAKY